MKSAPCRCVVDTNVAMTANGANAAARPECIASSAVALQAVMDRGHVFVDDRGLIRSEYVANLRARGQPGPGDAFLKWFLDHEWGETRVTRVLITPKLDDPLDFEELPLPPADVSYDPSDRMFLAVAAAHAEHPPILQSLDSKWWGWRQALAAVGVTIHFLCQDDIARMYRDKMSS